jgi:phage major head subunit gpT-like protein
MTVVKGDVSAFLEAGLRQVFNNVYNMTDAAGNPLDGEWRKVAMEMSSDGEDEKYAFLGNNPSMREFTDERVPSGLQSNSFTIVNKKFESTIAVDRDAISDDRYSQIVVKIQAMAEIARQYYNDRAWTVFFEGDGHTYGYCYDGNEFFDTAHKEGKYYTTNQSNLLTLALTAENLGTARLNMRNFRDDRGKKLGIVGDTLIVPPELEETAFKIVNSLTVDASGNANFNKGRYNIIVRPEIEDTDSWALVSTAGVIKPLIFQNREPTEFGALERNSETGFKSEKYLYGVRNRFNFGYGDWRRAVMSVPG